MSWVTWVTAGDCLLETPGHSSTPQGTEDRSPGSKESARCCGRSALHTHCATRAKVIIAVAQKQRLDFSIPKNSQFVMKMSRQKALVCLFSSQKNSQRREKLNPVNFLTSCNTKHTMHVVGSTWYFAKSSCWMFFTQFSLSACDLTFQMFPSLVFMNVYFMRSALLRFFPCYFSSLLETGFQ